MRRLSGPEAAFLALETPTAPMHVAALVLVDGRPAGGGVDRAAVRDLLAARLHLLAPLRRRVVEVPFGLDRPVAADDPDFALDDHLHEVRLPAPGGLAELAALVGGLLARPLPRGRPLWEMHVVVGLAGGRAAVVARVHHALADGAVGVSLLGRLLDAGPGPPAPAGPPPPWAPPPLPAPADLLAEALGGLGRRPRALAHAARLGFAALAAAPAAPRTPLNLALGRDRRVAWTSLSLDAARAVKAAFACTVTDVVLAACGSALRSWLAGRGEWAGGDLVALVPMAPAGAGGEPDLLAPGLVSLATTVDDPVERLRAVAASSARARAAQGTAGPSAVRAWSEAAPPGLTAAAARLVAGLRLAEVLPPAAHVVVSNVAGPPVAPHLAGAPVLALVPFGPLLEGVTLNLTVLGCAGRLHAGLVADPAALPDPAAVAAGLAPALDELAAAAVGRR